MSKTISGGPWDYLALLNECIKIMITILFGVLAGRYHVLTAETFVPQAVAFVFKIALPLHIIRGIGIGVDYYDDRYIWSYIFAFLIFRVIALVASIGMVVFKLGSTDTGIGQIAINWLCLSWISTVILGVPISQALLGDATIGLQLGVLAALLILELSVLERSFLTVKPTNLEVLDEEQSIEENVDNSTAQQQPTPEVVVSENVISQSDHSRLQRWAGFARQKDVWKRISQKIILNPVLWAIAIGFVLSLSTVGPKYLKPSSPLYVPGLSFIWDTLEWIGGIVSPLSLIAMGVWMEDQGNNLFQLSPMAAILYMFSKLFLAPLLMLGLAWVLGMNDTQGRAAVLIAALPISMASFSIGSHYDMGLTILSNNIALGSLLMLPTVLLWNIVLDALGIYVVPDSQQ